MDCTCAIWKKSNFLRFHPNVGNFSYLWKQQHFMLWRTEVYNSGELDRESTCSILEHMGNDGKQKYVTKFYNLDAILSVGYRVNSRNAALFRRWANSVLKEYLLKGHVINCRLEQIDTMLQKHERQIEYLTDKVDFFVRTSLPPVEGIFYDGQIFDAYKFATDLICTAKDSILLIDNYVVESVLLMLSKRNVDVKADIYTRSISGQLRLDLRSITANILR